MFATKIDSPRAKKSGSCWFCSPRRRRTGGYPSCSLVLEQPPKRPDPAIYSQRQLHQAGQIPTWRNPDIEQRGPDEERLIVAYISNLSAAVPATGARIDCDISTRAGIGVSRERLGSQTVNLDPSARVAVAFPVPEHLAGLYLPTYVTITLRGDASRINNYGEDVRLPLLSAVEMSLRGRFLVRNPTGQTVQWTLSVAESNASVESRTVPDSVTLAPGAEEDCMVVGVGAPADGAPMTITVLATDPAGGLVGGMTFSA